MSLMLIDFLYITGYLLDNSKFVNPIILNRLIEIYSRIFLLFYMSSDGPSFFKNKSFIIWNKSIP